MFKNLLPFNYQFFVSAISFKFRKIDLLFNYKKY